MSRRPTSPSLFSRLVHYRPLIAHSQEENQRTEALAATLETDRAFALGFLRKCLPAEVSGTHETLPISVETQAPAGGRARIDLQVRVGDPAVPAALVWVESKVKSPLSGKNQLQKYDEVLERRAGARGTLVHLRPGWMDPVPRDQRPKREMRELTWQDVGEIARCALGPEVQRHALTRQFLQFLNEENLAMTDPITTLDLLVVEEEERSRAVLRGLLDQIRRHVECKVGPAQGIKERNVHDIPYWDLRPFPGRHELFPIWREWKIERANSHGVGRLTFRAGLTLQEHVALDVDKSDHFEGLDFMLIDEPHEGLQRIFRSRPAAELLKFGGVDAQVTELGSWAVKAMQEAVDALESCPGWTMPPCEATV